MAGFETATLHLRGVTLKAVQHPERWTKTKDFFKIQKN